MHQIIGSAMDSQLVWGVIGLILAYIAFTGRFGVNASICLLIIAWVVGCFGIYRSGIQNVYAMVGVWLLWGSVLAFLAAWLQPPLPTDQTAPTKHALRIAYDEKKHRQYESNGQCCWFRIDVENMSNQTIQDVTVKIVELRPNPDEVLVKPNPDIVGLTLALAGTDDRPYTPPKGSGPIHAGDHAIFEVVRLCHRPGNHWITHSNYVQSHINPQTKRQMWEQKPHAVIPPGKYSITLIARGNNANGEAAKFEFGASENSVFFYKR